MISYIRSIVLEVINYIIICISVSAAILGFSISFMPNYYLGNRGVILLFGLPILIELFNIIIQSNFCKNEKERIYRKRQNFYVILFIYTLALINLLYIGSVYRSYSWVYNKIPFLDFIKESVNIIPFKTIFDYLIGYLNNSTSKGAILMNILGNLILLMPLAYILPELFSRKIREIKKFAIVILLIAILIETFQLIFMVGKVDIDDVILNTFGALIFYYIINIKIVRKVLKKIKMVE